VLCFHGLAGLCLAWQGGAAAPQAPAAAAQEIPFELRVNRAIALGVEHLKNRQQPNGSYRGQEDRHPNGLTALVAYTLLRSGVRKNDPALQHAMTSLAYAHYESTYSAAVHLLLCETLHDRSAGGDAQASLDLLLKGQEQGVWGYPAPPHDSSNTQFALLGLRAARKLGLEVPEETLLAAADGLKQFDDTSGGFLYVAPQGRRQEPEAYASITAAALASLAVLQDLATDSAKLRSALEKLSGPREKAEHWMAERFDPAHNRFTDGSWWSLMHFAGLWAVERWCGLSARKEIGGHDWYTEGATWLLAIQARDGSFGPRSAVEDTCFALLFLRRATVSQAGELAELYAEIDRRRSEGPEHFWRPGARSQRLADWWLAGPWPQSGEGPLLLDPPFAPKDVEPRAKGKLARKDWQPVALNEDSWTDLEVLSGEAGNRQLWVLATHLKVAGSEPVAALLWLALDDGWDVWLDGKSLSRELHRTLIGPEDVAIPLRLTPGEHLLTVLVEDRRGGTPFGAVLTDADNLGPPVGITPEQHERLALPSAPKGKTK
jgi:prenyltransferase beta subunit